MRIADILAQPIQLVKCLGDVLTEHVDSGRGCSVKITFDGHDHGGSKIRRSGIAGLDCLSLSQVRNFGDIRDGPIGNETLKGGVVGNQETLNGWRHALASRKSTISSISRVSSLVSQMVIGGEIAVLDILFLNFDAPNPRLLLRVIVLMATSLLVFFR